MTNLSALPLLAITGSSSSFSSTTLFALTNIAAAAAPPNTFPISLHITRRRKPSLPSPSSRRRNKSAWWRWWHQFFSDDTYTYGDPLSFTDPDPDLDLAAEVDQQEGEEAKFQAWRRRAEAISELREAQEDARNAEGRAWEDWLHGDGGTDASSLSSTWEEWGQQQNDSSSSQNIPDNPDEIQREKGIVEVIRSLVTGKSDASYNANVEDDNILFEDRVFNYASATSGKFIAILILVPWTLNFLVHDYLLMPFLDRYVKTVPLAAELLDVRRHQKLEMIKTLKVERARFRFEVEIGKSPPLSDEELWLELRHKAIELREEWRLENRKAFANIWSDMVYGITLFLIIYLNKSKVALLKFTGYKLLNNISDTGKAFLIILVTDIFLGYHSESGWKVLIEIILERYGLEVDQAAITIFVCSFPVVIDACVKLWLFKFLPRLSPNVTNIFREMKRH